MVKRINTNNRVKIIDRNSPHFGDVGDVIGVVSKPVGMRLRKHLQVRLDSASIEEIFLPEQLELIG